MSRWNKTDGSAFFFCVSLQRTRQFDEKAEVDLLERQLKKLYLSSKCIIGDGVSSGLIQKNPLAMITFVNIDCSAIALVIVLN
jgi:hypothetical protein